jgi:hypothetical protein
MWECRKSKFGLKITLLHRNEEIIRFQPFCAAQISGKHLKTRQYTRILIRSPNLGKHSKRANKPF